MDGQAGNKGRIAGIVLAVIVVGGGGVLGARYWLEHRGDGQFEKQIAEGDPTQIRSALLSLDKDKLKSEEGKKSIDLAAERLKSMSFAEMMEVMRSPELTDEQRRQLRRVGREIFMKRMQDSVDDYFDAPKEKRTALLDQQIDEMMDFREQMRTWREQQKDDPEAQAEREKRRRQFRTRDTQSAKERMEGGNPDQQKRMMAYWGKVRSRMQARGLSMGRGGGPGMRGGGHGSRGGSGGSGNKSTGRGGGSSGRSK